MYCVDVGWFWFRLGFVSVDFVIGVSWVVYFVVLFSCGTAVSLLTCGIFGGLLCVVDLYFVFSFRFDFCGFDVVWCFGVGVLTLRVPGVFMVTV